MLQVLPFSTPCDVVELDDLLSAPTAGVVDAMRHLDGDFALLGVGGKMGPTLARMIVRATQAAGQSRRVFGVSRFSNGDLPARLQSWGVEPIACDLLDESAVAKLPDVPNVISMSGFKFGAAANPSLAWAMNCYLPAIVCRRFHRSRIAAFSSGNVYGLTSPSSGGATESDSPHPVGEYAMTVLGRERMYEYFSRKLSIPTIVLRLNYATELRYGVLVDLARMVWNNEPVDVAMGFVNVIWQADANAMALQALSLVGVPPRILNLAGHEILRVREVCEQLGRLLGRAPRFVGQEATNALLNNAAQSHALFGSPSVSAARMIEMTADWIRRGGASLNKPTHFGSRDGKF